MSLPLLPDVAKAIGQNWYSPPVDRAEVRKRAVGNARHSGRRQVVHLHGLNHACTEDCEVIG